MSCIDLLNRTGGARKPNFDFTYLSEQPSKEDDDDDGDGGGDDDDDE